MGGSKVNALLLCLLLGAEGWPEPSRVTIIRRPVAPVTIHVPDFDDATDMPERVIVGYRTVCQNGVCRRVPIYADVPQAKPGHTHEALGGRVCDLCGRSCYMIRAAEAAAAAKGEYSDEAVRREYQARYGSGHTRQPVRLFRRR